MLFYKICIQFIEKVSIYLQLLNFYYYITFFRFIGNLIISYELFKNGKSYESDMKMLEIGNWLDKLDKSTDEFYLSINIGLKHIRMANFIHILFSTDEISGSKWVNLYIFISI